MRTAILITALMTTIFSGATMAADEMKAVKSRHFDRALAASESIHDLAATNRFHIADLDLSDVAIDQPEARFGQDEWTLSDQDRAGLQAMYLKAMHRRIVKAGYEVVAAPENGAVTIAARLTEIDPVAPKDDFHSRGSWTTYYSRGAGDATIEFTVSSGDEVLLIATDNRDVGHQWGTNDRFNNQRDVKRVFDSWANSLVKQLEKQRG